MTTSHWTSALADFLDIVLADLAVFVRECPDNLWEMSMWDVNKDPGWRRPQPPVLANRNPDPRGGSAHSAVWYATLHLVYTPEADSREGGTMRKLIYGMNVTLDGYIAAPGDDIGWGGAPSDELFQWWLDQERASGLSLYGRKLWETMSSYWPTGDQQPNATPAQIEFARNWRDTPKVVFSSTIDKVDWNTRLVRANSIFAGVTLGCWSPVGQ